MFPSWKAVQRYREVVIYTVGLMKDPRPLVEHIYEMQIEKYLNKMRTVGYDPSIDEDLFKSLYTESSVELSSDPLHNKYINYYDHYKDHVEKRPFNRTPVYFPSRLYAFRWMKEGVVLRNPLPEVTQIPNCAMYIYCADEAVTNTLLSICSRISKLQLVRDLVMGTVRANDSLLQAPRMINPQSVFLRDCKLPRSFMREILRGLFGSGESLEELRLHIDLSPVEGLLDELFEDLVSHHEARDRAGLTQRKLKLELRPYIDEYIPKSTNLSKKFDEKWRNRCRRVQSIACEIPVETERTLFIEKY